MNHKILFLFQWLKRLDRTVLNPAALGTVISVSSALQGCNDVVAKQESPIPVRVGTVASEPLLEASTYTGTVRARYERDIGFRVGGKIISRLVSIGDRVKSGDVIAELDPTDFKLACETQQAELSAAKSSRDAAVAAEQRYLTLKQEGWVAQAALDARMAAADEARSRVLRAERVLDVQNNQVAYTKLRADKDGVISSMSAESGQVVAAGQTIARIAELDELEAAVPIPEQKLDEAKIANATISLWPSPGKTFSAQLREISPEADSNARTFEARFSILHPDGDVQLGKTANVMLVRHEAKSIMRLPLAAVTNDANGSVVWVVRNDGISVERRPVKVATYAQDHVIISEGLTPGERVVTLGVHRLDERVRVRIVEPQSIASAGPAVRSE